MLLLVCGKYSRLELTKCAQSLGVACDKLHDKKRGAQQKTHFVFLLRRARCMRTVCVSWFTWLCSIFTPPPRRPSSNSPPPFKQRETDSCNDHCCLCCFSLPLCFEIYDHHFVTVGLIFTTIDHQLVHFFKDYRDFYDIYFWWLQFSMTQPYIFTGCTF